jgi:hypothetical protein
MLRGGDTRASGGEEQRAGGNDERGTNRQAPLVN